jgi:tRNA-Thr(GGU) m(6)t(6)A37 methyltransferase TsaA
VRFRNQIVTGAGGQQILAEDPSGNPVELFEPVRPGARLPPPSRAPPGPAMTSPLPSGSPRAQPARPEYAVNPIGRVASPLADPAQAPGPGGEGAPPAWLVIEPHRAEATRDLRAGEHIIVLTWLDRARRDELSTIPGDHPDSPPPGVFSTRSPGRPNPIGLHPVQIIAIDGPRLLVSGLEAVDHTPILDIKPVLDPVAER